MCFQKRLPIVQECVMNQCTAAGVSGQQSESALLLVAIPLQKQTQFVGKQLPLRCEEHSVGGTAPFDVIYKLGFGLFRMANAKDNYWDFQIYNCGGYASAMVALAKPSLNSLQVKPVCRFTSVMEIAKR